MPSEAGVGRNRLLLPLIGVSALCVAEAVVIAFLLGRGGGGATQRADAGGMPAPSNPTTPVGGVASPANDAPSAGPAITRGRLGERVESAGLAVTVTSLTNEPRFKEINTPPPTQKFVGVEVVLENSGAAAHRYFSTSFNVKDDRDRVYGSRALGAGDPEMGFGTIVPGEKVRGHLAFVVPKDAGGLTLTYGGGDMPRGYRPIHIELGQ